MLACLSVGWEKVKGENQGGVCQICFRTSAAFPAGQLQPDAAVELQGDESVGRHHDDAGDEEEQQQQGHVPAKGAEGVRHQAISAAAIRSQDSFSQAAVSRQLHRLRKSIRTLREFANGALEWEDTLLGPQRNNTTLMRLPGLLDDVIGPHQAAHVSGAVVKAGERLERAGDGVGQHEDGGGHPGGRNDLGGVGLGLPHSGCQRVADGAVALQGDGHQVEGGDAHRDACIHQSRDRREVVRLLDGSVIYSA